MSQAKGVRLRRERVQRIGNLDEAAELFKVSASTLSLVERGMHEPSPRLADAMAHSFGVSRTTIYRWYFETTMSHRKPTLIGNTKLR